VAWKPSDDPGGRALVDQIAESIRTRVLGGEILVGSRLRQETLAAEFGVSRTPIREALRKLQANGIVAVQPNRGAVVRGPTAREIRDAYEVRGELEGLAAELAATRIRDLQLGELKRAEALFGEAVARLVDRRERTTPPADGVWTEANDLFHRVIQEAGGNDRLIAIVQDLHRSFPRGLTWSALSGSSALLQQNVEEHAGIREAIEQHDPEEARQRMIAHITHAGELIAEHFERRDDYVARA
jgi:DNA-binding GntR family transcriptional regulator